MQRSAVSPSQRADWMTHIVAVDVKLPEIFFRDPFETTVAVMHALDTMTS